MEKLLRDPVIEALPLDKHSDPAIIGGLIFNIRIFHRNIIHIVFIIFLTHSFRDVLSIISQCADQKRGLLSTSIITQKKTARKTQAVSMPVIRLPKSRGSMRALCSYFAFFMQRLKR